MTLRIRRGRGKLCSNGSCKWGSSYACAGCKRVQYCSATCEDDDALWHAQFCLHVRSHGIYSTSYNDMQYYNFIALQDPKVRNLLKGMGLAVPYHEREKDGLVYVIPGVILNRRTRYHDD